MAEIEELVSDIESYQELESLRRKYGKVPLVTPEYDSLPSLQLCEEDKKKILEDREQARKIVEGRQT
jgi:hypothetical protein